MSDPTPSEIKYKFHQVDPFKFEELVAMVWRLLGYQTDVKRKTGDRGIDITATHPNNSNKILIQVKRNSSNNKISSGQVRKYATLYQQESNVDSIVIVTSSTFTDPAKQLAQDLDIQAINGDQLAKTVSENYDIFESFFDTSKRQTNSKNRRANKTKSRRTQSKKPNYLSKKEIKEEIRNKSKEDLSGHVIIKAENVAREKSGSVYSGACYVTLNYASKLFGGYGIKITPSGEVENFDPIKNVDNVTKAGVARYDHKPYAKIKKDSLSDVDSEFKVVELFLDAIGSDISKVTKVRKKELES